MSKVLEAMVNKVACGASTRWYRRFSNGGRWGIGIGQAPQSLLDGKTQTGSTGTHPVFVTARFRSGSTYLWNMFHLLGRYTAYYEPLHERRWFDPAARAIPADETHIETAPYHTNYEGLESLAELYDERWTSRRLYMDARATDRRLEAYIQTLIDHAVRQPVLQFNRVDYRLAWLRRYFPQARILHLYRSPREQWMSSLRGETVPADMTLADVDSMDLFYLKRWWRSLRYVFPGLQACRKEHPYRAFYFLWRWSYLMGLQGADVPIAYEDLAQAPQRVMREALAALALPTDGLDWERIEGMTRYRVDPRWPTFASAEWFEEIEGACDQIVEHALRGSGHQESAVRGPSLP